jgi:dTDP-4-dehydrorhamnose 3,5-epimerase
MKFIKAKPDGVYMIENFINSYSRGIFVKTFHKDFFKENKLCSSFEESYYSISKKCNWRHAFSITPNDHGKLVYAVRGKLLDVVLDLKKKSKTYLKFIQLELSEENRYYIYIPKGLAHGFKCLEDESMLVYNVSTIYRNKYDSGIRWDSFGMNWKIDEPILSARDKNFSTLQYFNNPFQ